MHSPVSHSYFVLTDASPKNKNIIVSEPELSIFKQYLMVVRDFGVTFGLR